MRAETPFAEPELRLARIAAGQAGLVIRAFAHPAREADSEAVLGLAGETLAVGGDEVRTAEQVTRIATDATAALAGLLWRRGPEAELELVASVGAPGTPEPLAAARAAADRALVGRHAVSVEYVSALPGAATLSATLQLGQPPLGALQLLFARDTEAGDVDLATLATFGVRAAHALRASMHAHSVELELESHACAARSRRPGDVATVARAYARDLSRARRRAARSRPPRRLPTRRRPPVRSRGARACRPACSAGRTAARSHARPVPLAWDARRRRRLGGSTFVGRCRRGSRGGDRGRDRGAAARARRGHRAARGRSRPRPRPDGERVGPAVRARCAAGRRRAERAAARAREAARRGAGTRPRSRARGVEAGARPVRDLTFVRAEPVPRSDARGSGRHDRGDPRTSTSRSFACPTSGASTWCRGR